MIQMVYIIFQKSIGEHGDYKPLPILAVNDREQALNYVRTNNMPNGGNNKLDYKCWMVEVPMYNAQGVLTHE